MAMKFVSPAAAPRSAPLPDRRRRRRMPRDGRFIEKLGTYNPLLPKDSEHRVIMDVDRIKVWLDHGARSTTGCAHAGNGRHPRQEDRANPKKGAPGKAAQERAEAKAAKAAEAAAAAAQEDTHAEVDHA